MNETYYGTKPGERLGLIKSWLDLARAGNSHLRSVFCRPDFIKSHDSDACFRGCSSSPPVPYLANRFCHQFLGCHIWDWVQSHAPEPDTGEVAEISAAA
jgi:hypothetical protein